MKSTVNKKKSLKKNIVVVLAVIWFVPIAIFSYFINRTYRNSYIEKTDKLMSTTVEVAGSLVMKDLDSAIVKSRRPTSDGEWEDLFVQYEKGIITRGGFVTGLRSSLISRFYMDESVARYALYLYDEEEPGCYSGKNGYGYSEFMNHVHPIVTEIREKDSNYTEIIVLDNELYLIRNLYTVNDYRKYGTLVLGLMKDVIFEKLPFDDFSNLVLVFNNQENRLTKERYEYTGKAAECYERMEAFHLTNSFFTGTYLLETSDYKGYSFTDETDNYKISIFYTIPKNMLYSDMYKMNIMVYIVLAFMIPLHLIARRFMHKNIEKPLDEMIQTAGELQNGKLGAMVDVEKLPNEEFQKLGVGFNEMSAQIKLLFDTVYSEQMAAKEAQISALIAQINPHFLNNTLEMMNWQARMNGDLETSKMIEALGTVLNFSINRDNERSIRLADELRCDDAYLYIISMRFGSRLKIEKEIQEGLENAFVPQLLLQPLLENAVKHGIERVQSGIIRLVVKRDGNCLLLEVRNTANPMTEEELKSINDKIHGKEKIDLSKPGGHTSIGIYNVNKRIQLIYGEDYGLTVNQEEPGVVVATIRLPM